METRMNYELDRFILYIHDRHEYIYNIIILQSTFHYYTLPILWYINGHNIYYGYANRRLKWEVEKKGKSLKHIVYYLYKL